MAVLEGEPKGRITTRSTGCASAPVSGTLAGFSIDTMQTSDIPYSSGYIRKSVSLAELLCRATSSARVSWTDLPEGAGIYVVHCKLNQLLQFAPNAGTAVSARLGDRDFLRSKWARICQKAPTDIIYIGKGDNVKKRVRSLIRFGLGEASNHHGGEWMWQIQEIATASILIQTCPDGKPVAFENWLLEKYITVHEELPLANRKGPEGIERWSP